jgi:ATP-dependent Clp protease ATP-binding subunit ClpB
LELPGIDIEAKDSSAFNPTTSTVDIVCRQEELCPNISGTESTTGATALHFACMRGDWEILTMLLEAGASHFVKDSSGRLPMAYFDLERVNPETYKAYHDALRAWTMCWRSLVKKGKNIYCMLYVIFSSIVLILCRYDITL